MESPQNVNKRNYLDKQILWDIFPINLPLQKNNKPEGSCNKEDNSKAEELGQKGRKRQLSESRFEECDESEIKA